ncbi:hypothetical protein TBLA_0B02580 [Henningerozyma blattae CBS 6284]|uniref:Autophagy-related protein 11 n=1 Tax=Henningerozyma blattae (strain ATCC 34711 / CBS 6284 / DSM 70876 / NBRC 10599 / NRRL Y-10934 / UCD 77-7) TaxID=1071380 RepID=I2GY98_HENB6|nr:hypothetical protein TBLA_0B02580 [Tetrapisispora blattae CBS 6284]CCH59100.1 hypothetical protein TBLA_0B02580 [Tetrapisispora blattae CBS 6284]
MGNELKNIPLSGVHIINTVTGQITHTQFQFFVNLEEFKIYAAARCKLPVNQLFILLQDGQKLTVTTFQECSKKAHEEEVLQEVYIFDRGLFSLGLQNDDDTDDMNELVEASKIILDKLQPEDAVNLIRPIESPLSDADIRLETINHRFVSNILTTNIGWLTALDIDIQYLTESIQSKMSDINKILKGLNVCSRYLDLYCMDSFDLFDSNIKYLNQLKDFESFNKWEEFYESTLANLKGITNDPLTSFLNKKSLDKKALEVKKLDVYLRKHFQKMQEIIDENANLQKTLNFEIVELEKKYSPKTSKSTLEETMISKFYDILSTMKKQQSVLLSKKDDDLSWTNLSSKNEIYNQLIYAKDNQVKTLLTIAQALFSQYDEITTLKKQLQIENIQKWGRIATIQINVSEIKKELLTNCNEELSIYKSHQLVFAKLKDFPIVYGLYLIELLRRKLWINFILKDGLNFATSYKLNSHNEEIKRKKWLDNFGHLLNDFNLELPSEKEDLKVINCFFGRDISNPATNPAVKLKNQQEETLTSVLEIENFLNKYISSLQDNDLFANSVDILTKNIEKVKYFQHNALLSENKNPLPTKFHKSLTQPVLPLDQNEIFLNNATGSGIDNNNKVLVNGFRDRISSMSNKMFQSNVISNVSSNSLFPTVKPEIEREYLQLKDEVRILRKENDMKTSKIQSLESQISDNNVEIHAYRETLTSLNKELSRLITEKEDNTALKRVKDAEFRDHIQKIINQNVILENKLISSSKYSERLEIENKKLLSFVLNIKVELTHMREDFFNYFDKAKSQLNLITLKYTNFKNKLPKSLLQQLPNASKNASVIGINQVNFFDQSLTSQTDSYINSSNNMPLKLLEMIVQIFKANVCILENIGLLPTIDKTNNIQIIRVRGLRNNTLSDSTAGSISDSTFLIDQNEKIKSTFFNNVFQEYSNMKNFEQQEVNSIVVNPILQLFKNHLLENAVVRRFKDIESLAKRYKKESKFRKSVLETYKKEKITLKNFEIGDLALFLPMSDISIPIDSKASSVNSSFSSVDLSTPPTSEMLMNKAMSSISIDTSSRRKSNYSWAAFTAYGETKRYILKEDTKVPEGNDWFLGRIVALQNKVVTEEEPNRYKLPLGSQWCKVSATII